MSFDHYIYHIVRRSFSYRHNAALSFQKKVPLQASDCMAMAFSENLNLRWDDFAANLSSALHNLRGDENFTDLTLVCADQQVEVHKVVLASSSKFFWRVLKNIKHSHPMIYLRGIKFKDLEAVLSFMYLGQVNLAQEDLDSFLVVAEELEVKGLTPGGKLSNCDANSQTQVKSCIWLSKCLSFYPS